MYKKVSRENKCQHNNTVKKNGMIAEIVPIQCTLLQFYNIKYFHSRHLGYTCTF